MFEYLRQKHPRFIYHEYTVKRHEDMLIFSSRFETEPGIYFSPQVVVHGVDQQRISSLEEGTLNNIAFHLGLMEIPSYWKATCSPEIVIQASFLDEEQIAWWRHLLLKGLSEFFFNNDIDFTKQDLFTFKVAADGSCPPVDRYAGEVNITRVLIPIGGGKDSPVTLEVLKKGRIETGCLCLNPIRAALGIAELSGCERPIIIARTIDDRLLELNRQGYLNGHTPFSAYIAFLSVACAVLFGYSGVAVSNERSSDEGNTWYKGRVINHQYSKSSDFERRFRSYSQTYLAGNIDYFSFLRPLYELQIVKLFSRFPQYFPVFQSCNRGQETDSWCGRCPKCLFVFTTLFPFLQEDILLDIFSESLFEKDALVELALSLVGEGVIKPFECIGTKEESIAAFYLCVKRLEQEQRPFPTVLRVVKEQVLVHEHNMEQRVSTILNSWNDQHWIPAKLQKLLQKEIVL